MRAFYSHSAISQVSVVFVLLMLLKKIVRWRYMSCNMDITAIPYRIKNKQQN